MHYRQGYGTGINNLHCIILYRKAGKHITNTLHCIAFDYKMVKKSYQACTKSNLHCIVLNDTLQKRLLSRRTILSALLRCLQGCGSSSLSCWASSISRLPLNTCVPTRTNRRLEKLMDVIIIDYFQTFRTRISSLL